MFCFIFKIFSLSKNGGHFESSDFSQRCQTQNYSYLIDGARQSNFVEIFGSRGTFARYSAPFSKFFLFPIEIWRYRKLEISCVSFTVQDRYNTFNYFPLESFFAKMQSPTLLPCIKLCLLHISFIKQMFFHSFETHCFCLALQAILLLYLRCHLKIRICGC